MPLFVDKPFTSSAGIELLWKIECDTLRDDDIACLAAIIARKVRFKRVVGVPRGGLRLAAALEKFKSDGPTLIVDDVLTTGKAMEKAGREWDDRIGVVIFARKRPPHWVWPVFKLNNMFRD